MQDINIGDLVKLRNAYIGGPESLGIVSSIISYGWYYIIWLDTGEESSCAIDILQKVSE